MWNAFYVGISIEMIMWFLSFILLLWCTTLINFLMSNHPCIPEIDPTWSWCIILIICWIQFVSILLKGFFVCLHQCSKGILFCIFSLVVFLSGFDIRVMLVSQHESRSVPSSSNFRMSLGRIGVISPLNVW